jgi:sulfite reductase (ferredoxin)
MSLGGRSDGDSMLGVNCLRVPAKRIIPVILKIIESFKKNKKSDDTLSSWINRIVRGNENSEIKSVNDLKQILSPHIVPPTKEEDADFYLDYGSDKNYHTITGKGECAA